MNRKAMERAKRNLGDRSFWGKKKRYEEKKEKKRHSHTHKHIHIHKGHKYS